MSLLYFAVLQAVRSLGGFSAAAKKLQLRSQRGPRHGLKTPEQTAQALQEFMASHAPPEAQQLQLQQQLKGPARQSPRTRRRSGTAAAAASDVAKRLLAAAGLPTADAAASHGCSLADGDKSGTDGGEGLNGSRGACSAWRVMPSQQQLKAAGRADLVAALQRHGAIPVATLLGLPIARRGGRKKVIELLMPVLVDVCLFQRH